MIKLFFFLISIFLLQLFVCGESEVGVGERGHTCIPWHANGGQRTLHES